MKNNLRKIIFAFLYVISFCGIVFTLLFGVILSDARETNILCSIIVLIITIVTVINFHIDKHILRKEMQRRKKTIEETILTAKMEATEKTKIIADVSHRILKPVSIINDESSKMVVNLNNQNELKTSIHKINVSSKHLHDILLDMINVSLDSSNDLSVNNIDFTISSLVRSVLKKCYSQIIANKLQFSFDCSNVKNNYVVGDYAKVEHIFTNTLFHVLNRNNHILSISVSEITVDDKVTNYQIVVKDDSEKLTEKEIKKENSEISKIVLKEYEMTVVKSLVMSIGGTIEITNNLEEEGNKYVITIPLKVKEKNNLSVQIDSLIGYVSSSSENNELFSNILTRCNSNLSVSTFTDVKKTMEFLEGNRNSNVILFVDIDKYIETMFIDNVNNNFNNVRIILTTYDYNNINNNYNVFYKPLIESELLLEIKSIDELLKKTNDYFIDLSNKRVLVVEDNEINREIAVELISRTKAQVEVAENGLIAYEKVNNRVVGYYDFIFMDLQMPVMDGYETARKIRSIKRKDVRLIPIVAMTANTFSDDILKIKSYGMNDYLAKPIDIDELYSILKLYLNN